MRPLAADAYDTSGTRLAHLTLRLIWVRGRRKMKGEKRRVDIWLLTNVWVDRMSVDQAALYYRLRWENEGLFRSYKRTLNKVHLVGQTVRSVHREAYGSFLACQLLLAQGAWALQASGTKSAAVVPCGPRKAILAVRGELKAVMRQDRRLSYREPLAQSARERRERKELEAEARVAAANATSATQATSFAHDGRQAKSLVFQAQCHRLSNFEFRHFGWHPGVHHLASAYQLFQVIGS
jgi:hypothetical protein